MLNRMNKKKWMLNLLVSEELWFITYELLQKFNAKFNRWSNCFWENSELLNPIRRLLSDFFYLHRNCKKFNEFKNYIFILNYHFIMLFIQIMVDSMLSEDLEPMNFRKHVFFEKWLRNSVNVWKGDEARTSKSSLEMTAVSFYIAW
jgi:hypothetical protein